MRGCIGGFLAVCFMGLVVVGGCIALVGMTGSAIVEQHEKQQQAERERLANMTPEEREAEEKRKAEEAAQREQREAEIAEARAAADPLTMANYNRITTGMSEADVVAILGAGEEQASNRFGEGTEFDVATKIVAWAGFLKSINVTFQNGKVVQKAQFGL